MNAFRPAALSTLALAALLSPASARAAITIDNLGTAAPPPVLRGSPMAPAPADPSGVFSDITSLPLAAGVSLSFDTPMSHRQVGSSWATWSHGYSGAVYYTNGATTVTMTPSGGPGVDRIAFYGEPNPFGVFNISATATSSLGGSTTLSLSADGSGGATGFGISALAPGESIQSIQVSSDVDFAVGEFRSHTAPAPAPGPAALLGLSTLITITRHRKA